MPHHSVLTPWVWGQVPSLPKGRHLGNSWVDSGGPTQPFFHMKGVYIGPCSYVQQNRRWAFQLKESKWRRENHSHFQVKKTVFSMEVAEKIGQKEPFLLGTGRFFKSFLSYNVDFWFCNLVGKYIIPSFVLLTVPVAMTSHT